MIVLMIRIDSSEPCNELVEVYVGKSKDMYGIQHLAFTASLGENYVGRYEST